MNELMDELAFLLEGEDALPAILVEAEAYMQEPVSPLLSW